MNSLSITFSCYTFFYREEQMETRVAISTAMVITGAIFLAMSIGIQYGRKHS